MIRRLGAPGFHGVGGIALADLGVACPGAAAAGNGLLNNLIAYWPGNEANGNLLDLHTNGITLVDNNTVTSAAGLVYPTARQYTAANHEFFNLNADLFLSTGDVDFTWSLWVYRTGIGADDGLLSRLWTDYWLGITAANVVRFTIYNAGAPKGTVNSTATVGAAAWHLITVWHDSVANTVNAQIDDGAAASAATTGAPNGGAATFDLGLDQTVAWMNGRIGPTMFWKSAAGGGGVLTAAQRTALYNAGAGLTYAAFTL